VTTKEQLLSYGCPYKADDPRVIPWLDGYAKGHAAAYKAAIASLENAIPALFQPTS